MVEGTVLEKKSALVGFVKQLLQEILNERLTFVDFRGYFQEILLKFGEIRHF